MAGFKRFLAAIAAAGALTVAALGFVAAPGNAAPYVKAPTLSLSATSACKSSSITVTGTDFVPGSRITLTLRPPGTPLGSVFASSSGGFTKTVLLPEVTGTFQIVASGRAVAGNSNTAKARLQIIDCATPAPTATSPAVPPATFASVPPATSVAVPPATSAAVPPATSATSGPVPITGYNGGPFDPPGYAVGVGLAALALLTLGGVLLTWWRRRRKSAA
jgi:hypothetical protein